MSCGVLRKRYKKVENAQRERERSPIFLYLLFREGALCALRKKERERWERSFFSESLTFPPRKAAAGAPPPPVPPLESLSRKRERGTKKIEKYSSIKRLKMCVCAKQTLYYQRRWMNDARNSMRDDRDRRGGEKTLIFFCSSRVRVCARIFDARARENFVIRRRLGNFETMAPLPSQCARAFSRTRQLIQTPLWNFVRVRASLMRRLFEWRQVNRRENWFFPLSSFSSRLPTRVLTNVCFGEETRLATMRW